MSWKKKSITLNGDQLHDYMELAWRTCWDYLDSQPPDTWKRQDYVTASDIETCIRWLVDRDSGEAAYCGQSWWGHQGWLTIRIKDGQRGSLLSRCQMFLYQLARDGQAVGHNFGRGHISGARYRRAGSDVVNEKELKTLENKAKEKPVHKRYSGPKGTGHGLLCMAARKGGGIRAYRREFSTKTRSTDDESKVTCTRCLNLLRKVAKEQ